VKGEYFGTTYASKLNCSLRIGTGFLRTYSKLRVSTTRLNFVGSVIFLASAGALNVGKELRRYTNLDLMPLTPSSLD